MLLHAYYKRDPRVQRAAQALRGAGWIVKVICLNEGGESRREEVDGVQIIRCNMSRSRRRTSLTYVIEYLGFMAKSLVALVREDWRTRHDVVIVHNMPNALVFSTLPLRLRGCPVILDMHDAAPETLKTLFGLKSPWLAKLVAIEESLAMRYANQLITVNRGVEAVFRRRHPWAKFLLIHNSPSSKHMDRPVLRPNWPNGAFRIVFHGHLHERNGVQRLIDVLPRLVGYGVDVTLDVYGAGPYQQALGEQVHGLGLEKIVRFHGAFAPNELPQILDGKHLGVTLHFPDEFGDLILPVKILEYTQAGTPVLCSRLATVKEYFSKDAISYFDTPDELVEQILQIYQNYPAALEKAARARDVTDSISWERDSARLVEFVESLCRTV